MPFLYEGIEASVMDDFVGLEIAPLNHATLRLRRQMFPCPDCQFLTEGEIEYIRGQRTIRCTRCHKRIPKRDARDPSDRLREWRRLIFLGGAGIGKTTFQRFTILTILRDKSKVDFLGNKEKPIPFYVPLKAVENIVEFPILKYLIANNSFLSRITRTKALSKLRGYADQGHLFLFLDGYDEIQFGAGQKGAGFIQQELNLIMGTERFPLYTLNPDDKNAGFQALYESLSICRVWLSSRWEFYEQHRLEVASPNDAKRSPMSAVEIQGIADNRQNLIKKIFNKHKNEVLNFEDLFNAEYFLQQIETSQETELVELSYNPLFLTIMCFIYASAVISENRPDVNWASSFNDLVRKCIHLLVRKLDEDKIPKGSRALKLALLARRGEYPDEKEKFLRYFAFKLFDDNTRLFDLEYIREKAVEFFRTKSESKDRDTISAALEDDEIERPHIGRQLIYSGVFVLVDRHRQNVLYDFPHLRFRELLASEYLIDRDPDYLINNIDQRNLSELLYVFFNRSSLQDSVLTEIFKHLTNNPEPEFLSALLLNCLNRKPREFSATNAIRGFLLQCLRTDSFFTIRSEVLTYFQPDAAFMQQVANQFDIGLNETQTNKLLLACHLLSRYEKAVFRDHVSSRLLPEFQVTNMFVANIVVNHKELAETIKQHDLGFELREFFRISEIFDSIKRENSDLKWPKDREPEYCFLVTDEILQGMSTVSQLPSTEISALRIKLKFKLFFSTHFLGEFRGLNRDIKEYIIERSRISYQLCQDIIRTLEHVKKHPPLGAFFN
jgi:hypothetical protein